METTLTVKRQPASQSTVHPVPVVGTAAAHHEKKRFLRGVLYAWARYGATVFTGFAYWFLSARLLGAEIMGLFALLTSILGLFRPLSSLGEQFGLVPILNRYAVQNSQATALYITTVLVSVISTLCLSVPYALATGFLLINVYHHGELLGLMLLYMVGFYSIYNLMGLFNAPFLAYQQMQYTAISELMGGLTRILLLVVFVIAAGATPAAAVFSHVGGFLMSIAVLLVFLPKLLSLKAQVDFAVVKEDLKGIYRFCLKSLPATASIPIFQHADRLILGYFVSPSALGVYALVYALFERVLMMGTGYEDMVFSSASRATNASDKPMAGAIYRTAIRSAMFWILPIVAILSGFAGEVLSVFGSEFTQGAVALSLLLVGILFDGFSRISTGFIGGLNRPGLKATIVVIGALINLILNLILIPAWGIVGAAAANSLGYFATAVICGWVLLRLKDMALFPIGFCLQIALLVLVNALLYMAIVGLKPVLPFAWLGAALFAAGFLAVYYYLGKARLLKT